MARIFHAHLWGDREGKYGWLREHDVATTEWSEVNPAKPFYLFTPQDEFIKQEYEEGLNISEIFPIYNTGLITSRDKFVMGFQEDEVTIRIQDFKNLNLSETKHRYGLRDVRGRTLYEAWSMVKTLANIQNYVTKVQYRPFDQRFLFYHHSLVRWPVYNVMNHMLKGKNIGLISARSNKSQTPDHFFCSRLMVVTRLNVDGC